LHNNKNLEIEGEEDFQVELLQDDADIELLFACFNFTRNLEALWTIPISISSDELQDYVSIVLSGLQRNVTSKSSGKKKSGERKESTNNEPKKYVSEQVICYSFSQ
jgi:hypothetical protein